MYPLSKNSETTCNISYKFPHVIFIKKSWKLFQHIQKSFRFFFRICKSLCSYRASFLTSNFIFRNRRTLLSPCLFQTDGDSYVQESVSLQQTGNCLLSPADAWRQENSRPNDTDKCNSYILPQLCYINCRNQKPSIGN